MRSPIVKPEFCLMLLGESYFPGPTFAASLMNPCFWSEVRERMLKLGLNARCCGLYEPGPTFLFGLGLFIRGLME